MDLSIVISIYNENESLEELVTWIRRALENRIDDYEIIMVDDGSTDGSWATISRLSEKYGSLIKGISFRRNYGKSAALYCGFAAASGDVVVTMDADLQDSPDEIPELYRMIREEGYDLVSGWKKHRLDNKLTKNIPSKIYNATARRITGIRLHDMNCGLKAYRNEVVKNIEVYGEMHRYIPYLAKNAGFTKIGEKEVVHRKRKFGKSKFGVNRFVNGYLDLLSLWFLMTFGRKPMHLFGLIGSLLFIIGGYLLYSTCSINQGEDEEIIKRFMRKHPGEAEEVEINLEYGEKREFGMIVLPDNSNGRGPMYAALLRKI